MFLRPVFSNKPFKQGSCNGQDRFYLINRNGQSPTFIEITFVFNNKVDNILCSLAVTSKKYICGARGV